MREAFPLQMLIRKIEQIRDACYVCDRAPLEEMLDDLRRWSIDLSPPELQEQEVVTVQERVRVPRARTG
jgi:hypothetical protein